ncbi:hypothetical protein HZF05_04210 [Sphingomonas sp. CGMCC 1.13654]|uniref:Lectin-like protein BA14k n=1 Tax=Sphingomonas chungangi TaxID=2683589 RepID=A0A838L408_9SPHN|nr:hypothetical protein [Sphingomonas chungangi]MBA2933292.1 hypothetical protein [Sphingomonas chungangi]MVW57962.1 hypothetical protein [Sphingomonas chungangi]
MRKPILAVVTAATLVAGTIGMAAPAEARVSTGTAVVAGILGLGVGAAITSDHPHRYYNDGYYAPPPPPPAPVYYAPPPPPPAYSYEYVQRCRVVDRWDPYYDHYVRDRRCY